MSLTLSPFKHRQLQVSRLLLVSKFYKVLKNTRYRSVFILPTKCPTGKTNSTLRETTVNMAQLKISIINITGLRGQETLSRTKGCGFESWPRQMFLIKFPVWRMAVRFPNLIRRTTQTITIPSLHPPRRKSLFPANISNTERKTCVVIPISNGAFFL